MLSRKPRRADGVFPQVVAGAARGHVAWPLLGDDAPGLCCKRGRRLLRRVLFRREPQSDWRYCATSAISCAVSPSPMRVL